MPSKFSRKCSDSRTKARWPSEAQALRKIIPVGKVIGERAINQAAQDFEQRLFKVGGLGTVEAVLKKVLNRALMRQIHVSYLEMSG